MSEATSRPSASRGRGSGRGGRGGFAGRGGRRTNGSDSKTTDEAFGAFDDDGELAELRKKYGDKTGVIREMFPDWSEVDVLFALQETNGDQTEAVTKIAEGAISQWGEVSKPKKATKPKAKDAAPASTPDQNTTTARATRGGRAVSEGARGRGRATERGGRGGTRGRPAQPAAAGARNKENEQLSVPTEESSVWGTGASKPEAKAAAAVEKVPVEAPKPAAGGAAPAAKTWASMLRQTTVPKPAPKEAPRPKAPEAIPTPAETKAAAPENETTPVAQAAVAIIEEPALLPPQDDLTETNLEQVVDDSQPAATGTAASTAADSWDPRQSPISSNATPLSAAHQQHQPPKAPISGYAASAIKATERTNRAPSFQRRVLDQEEAVRMPGNRDVDRAAVKFGAFNLNGGDEDVDGDREDAETRTQPPAESPVSHPRASLPPVQQQHVAVPDAFSQKPAAPSAPPGINPAGAGAHGAAQAAQPGAPQQYGRFGQAGPHDAGKPIDPFGQQAAAISQPPFDLNATSQPPAHGAFSSAPGDYSNYYTANQQDRNPYNYYGQHYGQQQGVHGQHDGAAAQRPVGGYNAQADNLSQYPQSGAAHSQPRFGASADSQNSGHSTPNPASQAQQQQGQGAPGTQPQAHGQYPGYNHPYYPYYHQYYSGYGQGGFGPYGKGGMYGQPYGVSPNAPYDHATTQSNFGPSTLHRDNSLGSGLGDYGRAQSGQAGSQPGLGGSGFGGSHDSFQRGAGSFQNQSAANAADDLKPFGDKAGSGPSPSLGGARPGSAANTPGQGSGLPPPQGGAYGGYPSHLQGHGAYGMGGAGGANQHGNAPYGSYGQGFGSGGGYYGAGQQQRGGWGGNYH